MFGHDWDRAEASIVARDSKFSGDGQVATRTFVADVRLADGEVFRATVHEPTIAADFWPPVVGDVVSVLVRRNDRKVKFDKDDERLSARSRQRSARVALEDAAAEPPGTPPPGRSAAAGSGADPGSTPEERLARLTSLRDRGLVTPEEYDEQRRRILDEL